MARQEVKAADSGTAFGIRSVLRDVAWTYRHAFGRVAISAVLVFGTTAVVDVLVAQLTETGRWDVTNIVLIGSGVLTNAIGLTFYPGFLDGLVGEARHGHEPTSAIGALRTLPYGRLIAADLLVVAITAAGFVLLVVPGLVAFTLLALTGPMITLENLRPVAAMRRSAQLARRHFWLVFLLVVVPLEFEHSAMHAVRHHFEHSDLVTVFLAHGLTGLIVGSFVGVVVVNVAIDLRDEEATLAVGGEPVGEQAN